MSSKRILAIVLTLVMTLVCLPFGLVSFAEGSRIVGTGGLVLDTDATGGYEGEYVVIYNPATSSSTSYSTGTLTGLIETDVGVESKAPAKSDELAIIDVDGDIAAREREELGDAYGKIDEEGGTRASYQVGSTKSFTISSYNPGSGSSLTFKVLAVGEHCYIWTPSQNVANYYTLDSINPDYAEQAAAEFDRMYNLMNTSFGNHSNGSNGDGKVSLLFYNIDDGFDPETSSGYVAGYFSSASYSYDGMPIINIDTYPGIYYVTPSGVDRTGMDRAYGTACHEYQHCINYSNTSSMSTWLNECFSAAAEEICYPGSSIVSRIQSWEQYYYGDEGDWLNPPAEFNYDSSLTLHAGFSMYNWSNYLEMYDTLALYAQVSFFAQYLYTQFGNSIYKQISNKYSSSEATAITNATGVNCAELVKNFRIAIYANDHEAYDGQYGFIPQADYDPEKYHDVENPYNLLGPVVFTGSSCSIKGGGAICVKPVNGVFNPPSGASSNLVYIGITRNVAVEPVELEGISVTPETAELLLDQDVSLALTREPANANTYEVVWTSSNDAIATVEGGNRGATVTSHAKGTAIITATATDTETGAVFTDTAVITVKNGYTYDYFEPTNTVETGVEYLIGYNNGGNVYLLMNYNPNPIGGNNYYYSVNSNYVAYGIKAVLDGNGNVTGVDTSTYSGAQLLNAEWVFQSSGNYYTIGSVYQNGYYLRVYQSSNYTDLYAANGTSYATNWQWDSANNRLSYYLSSSLTKYVAYLATAGSYSNFFQASTGTASVQLYKHVTGTVMFDDTYTVTFVDWDGTVIDVQEVDAGTAAVAPAAPAREGYTFTGWDVDFSNVTENLTVTAQYSINSYLLTINYVYEDGTPASAPYTAQIEYGAAYSVATTEIEGYTFDIEVVEGVMGAGDVNVTVTYTAVVTLLIGDVNVDGHVDFADVSCLYMFLIGSADITPQGMLNADVDQNGNVDFSDITVLYTMLLEG